MSILDSALAYAEAGAFIVPLKSPRGPDDGLAGKMPLLGKGWQNKTSNDPEVIKGWFKKWPDMNIGIHMGPSALCCIDIDPRNGGLKWYSTREKWFTDEFNSVIEESGRGDGGKHIYLLLPEDEKVRNRLHSTKLAPGVDFLMGNKQAVVSPSIHAATKRPNKWITDFTMADREGMAELSGILLEEVLHAVTPKIEGDLVPMELDKEPPLRDYERDDLIEDLNQLDPAAGRHASIGRWIIDAVACRMPDEEIHELASDWLLNNGRQEGEQPREVSNWIREARQGLTTGKYSPSDNYRPERLLEILPELPPEERTNEWLRGLDRLKSGALKPSRNNVIEILTHDERISGCLGFNLHCQAVGFVKAPPWRPNMRVGPAGAQMVDRDIIAFSHWIAKNYKIEVSVPKVFEGIEMVAQDNVYHPVQNHILKEKWDGVKRLDTVFQDYFGSDADPLYLSACARTLFIGGVARAFRPGCKLDQMVILEGEQGIRKSTAIAVIGGPYYTDDLGGEIGQKDVVENIRFRWCVEQAELDHLSRAETNRFKAFLTRTTDMVRISYGRLTQEFPRQCFFVGTTNSRDYLRDATGGRRFLPVPCWNLTKKKPINTEGLQEVIAQLWAEAYDLFSKGATWWSSDKEVSALAEAMQASRQQVDEWETPILLWLEGRDPTMPDGKGEKKLQTSSMELWEKALGGDVKRFDMLIARRISSVMRALGWKKKTVYQDGVKLKGYRRPEDDGSRD